MVEIDGAPPADGPVARSAPSDGRLDGTTPSDGPGLLGAPRPGRVGRVERVMGTVVSIDIRGPGPEPAVLDRVAAYLHDVDRRFSPFLAESEVSRIRDGRLNEADASPDVRFILGLCDDLARTTDGYFDARGHRADGQLDPSGVVKGWAIDEAAWIVEAAGSRDFSVNAGGDIVARGGPEPGSAWRVGIRHPHRPDRLAAVLSARDVAIATSGAYERGAHILVPGTHRPPTGLLSLTVVGPSLTYADAFATAGFAMGREGVAWLADRTGYEALGITDDDRLVWTPGMDALLA